MHPAYYASLAKRLKRVWYHTNGLYKLKQIADPLFTSSFPMTGHFAFNRATREDSGLIYALA